MHLAQHFASGSTAERTWLGRAGLVVDCPSWQRGSDIISSITPAAAAVRPQSQAPHFEREGIRVALRCVGSKQRRTGRNRERLGQEAAWRTVTVAEFDRRPQRELGDKAR